MRTILKAIGIFVLFAGATFARAEVSVVSILDWSRFSVSTTGDVTVEFGPMHSLSTLTYGGVSTSTPGYLHHDFAQDDVTASLDNNLETQGSTLVRSYPNEHGLFATTERFANLMLSGTGEVILSIPYLLDVGAQDGFVAMGSAGMSVYSYFDSDPYRWTEVWGRSGVPDQPDVPWYINDDGTPQAQGYFLITLTSSGGSSLHEFRSWTTASIPSLVPEPETYAMMGCGVFAIALVRMRRTRR